MVLSCYQALNVVICVNDLPSLPSLLLESVCVVI